jgi:hypothetical protein
MNKVPFILNKESFPVIAKKPLYCRYVYHCGYNHVLFSYKVKKVLSYRLNIENINHYVYEIIRDPGYKQL